MFILHSKTCFPWQRLKTVTLFVILFSINGNAFFYRRSMFLTTWQWPLCWRPRRIFHGESDRLQLLLYLILVTLITSSLNHNMFCELSDLGRTTRSSTLETSRSRCNIRRSHFSILWSPDATIPLVLFSKPHLIAGTPPILCFSWQNVRRQKKHQPGESPK